MATINQNTQVPNFVFDACLPLLKEAELKTLLVIIRQTIGWIDRSTGKRKVRDRISNSQFRSKTGMSKRVITSAIQSLVDKGLVAVTDYEGRPLDTPLSRKGKSYLFFSHTQHVQQTALCRAGNAPAPAQKSDHNKNNFTKITKTNTARAFSGHIGELVKKYVDG